MGAAILPIVAPFIILGTVIAGLYTYAKKLGFSFQDLTVDAGLVFKKVATNLESEFSQLALKISSKIPGSGVGEDILPLLLRQVENVQRSRIAGIDKRLAELREEANRKAAEQERKDEEERRRVEEQYRNQVARDTDLYNNSVAQLEAQRAIQANTARDTSPGFIDQTVLTLQESVDRILGIRPRDTTDVFLDMRDLMEQQVQITNEMIFNNIFAPAQGS